MNRKIILSILSILITSTTFADSIVIVSNPPLQGDLSLEDLKQIYLQNGARISGGTVVAPIDYQENYPLREEFYRRVLNKSKVQMKSYWAQRLFTGKGVPPATVESANAAKDALVQKVNPTITYLRESELDKRVKIVLRLPQE